MKGDIMSIQPHHQTQFRLSLRELFLGVLIVAMAIVSLLYASPVWHIVMGLLVLLVYTGAIIGAIVDRGPRQALAIGMVVAMTVYAATLIYACLGSDFNTEFMSGDARVRLPTTRLLRSLYGAIVVREEIELPPVEPGALGTRAGTIERPLGSSLMLVGHCWWSLLLGYAGGRFALYLYLRRTNDSDPLAAASY
jgi:hypothetical protein